MRGSGLLLRLAAGTAAAVGAWLSVGALAVTGDVTTSERVGLLPPLWGLALLLVVALGAMIVWRVQSTRVLPLFLSLLLWLPWLPGPIPVSFLLWTGPVVVLVWTAILICLAAGGGAGASIAKNRWLRDPQRAPLTACALALVLCAVGFWYVSPRLPGGDEPHYLIITESLLYDGDLQIENNHTRGEYHEYFAGVLRPDFLRRGQNGQIYSVHAPGLAALVAPAFALGGYHAVVAFLSLLGAAGAALAWHVAYRVAGSVAAAWFGWAVVFLSAPFFFHTFTIYPDGPAAVLVLVGMWGLTLFHGRSGGAPELRWRLVACGAAMAFLPWLHTRYSVLAGMIGALVIARLARRPAFLRSAAAFLALPLVSAAAWLSFFYVIYGRVNPTIPYGGFGQGTSRTYVFSGLTGLFFDQQFGLVPNAPAYLCAFAGLAAALFLSVRSHESGSRVRAQSHLAVEMLLIVVPYLIVVTTLRMWWGGWSPPARFAVPVLLMLAAPAAVFWTSARSEAWRYLALLALGLNAAIVGTMIFVENGFLIFNSRDGFSLWLEWTNRVIDLPMGLPSFHQRGGVSWIHVGYWALAIGGVVLALRLLEGRLKTAGGIALVTVSVSAGGVMVALEAVWRSQGVTGLAPTGSQLALLDEFHPALRPTGVYYSPLTLSGVARILPRMRIPPSDRVGLRVMPEERPFVTFPLVPAGRYRVLIDAPEPAGQVVLRVGRTGQPLAQASLDTPARGATIEIKLPVRVHSLQIYADEVNRTAIRDLWLEPVAVRHPLLPYARRATRHGSHVVFFLNDNVFEEQAGFWVRGSLAADLVVTPDRVGRNVVLFVRNGMMDNHVELSSGRWHVDLAMRPGEERSVTVPVDREVGGAVVRVTSAEGFRPVDVYEDNKDRRFLGVWLEVR